MKSKLYKTQTTAEWEWNSYNERVESQQDIELIFGSDLLIVIRQIFFDGQNFELDGNIELYIKSDNGWELISEIDFNELSTKKAYSWLDTFITESIDGFNDEEAAKFYEYSKQYTY